MPDLEIDIDADGTLVVRGAIDAASAPMFADAVHASPSAVIIDVRDCSFMDSTGISVLVEAKALADARSTEFRLVAPSPAVAKVLDVSGMSDVLGLGAPWSDS